MGYQAIFKRYEIKFLLNREQETALKLLMKEYMTDDRYGRSTICNLYFDSHDFLLIRRSLEKPVYKEKLRLRSYGRATSEKEVFAELKKKFKGVVYKRRLEMTEKDAMSCLAGEKPLPDTQIGREIAYCFRTCGGLKPRVFLSYEREAFFAKENGDFRMTFDRSILWRDYDLSLCSGVYGSPILSDDYVLLEVKTPTAMPLWLVKFLSSNKIYKTSFSKYGRAYLELMKSKTQEEEKKYA